MKTEISCLLLIFRKGFETWDLVSNDIPEGKKIGSENSALPLDTDYNPWSVIFKRGLEECTQF